MRSQVFWDPLYVIPISSQLFFWPFNFSLVLFHQNTHQTRIRFIHTLWVLTLDVVFLAWMTTEVLVGDVAWMCNSCGALMPCCLCWARAQPASLDSRCRRPWMMTPLNGPARLSSTLLVSWTEVTNIVLEKWGLPTNCYSLPGRVAACWQQWLWVLGSVLWRRCCYRFGCRGQLALRAKREYDVTHL